jgi:hypothetical protein
VASAPAIELSDLTIVDLEALRLAAQVMAHRAHLMGSAQVGLYFESLESAVHAELAARGQQERSTGPSIGSSGPPVVSALLTPARGSAEALLALDHLDLLASNQGLSPDVRAYCSGLRRSIADGRTAP